MTSLKSFNYFETVDKLCENLFKVKKRNSQEYYFLEEKLNADNTFVERYNLRKNQKNPFFLELLDVIQDKKQVYLLYPAGEHENLKDLVKRCLTEDLWFSENFIWHLIYHLACAVKLKIKIPDMSHIFIDKNLNMKFLENHFHSTDVSEYILNNLLYQICCLNLSVSVKSATVDEIPDYFSKELKDFMIFVMNETLTADYILCHPTVLLKSRNVKPDSIFITTNGTKTRKPSYCENCQIRLNHVKNKETTLKIQEQDLQQREYELRKREKKLNLMEQQVKEKLLHAEVYLKRSRNFSSSSSNSNTNKKIDYDDLNTTLSAADCDQSVTLPVSKLDLKSLIKPPHFSRTKSERKIKFKGHSPLKDKCSNMEKTNPNTSKMKLEEYKPRKNSERLFASKLQLDRISWTEESKRHAFDLLRLMNTTTKEKDDEVKHTNL